MEIITECRECRELIKKALKLIIENDKTEYDYHGKLALNRNGRLPGKGQRFMTPREIAKEALCREIP